MKWKDLKYCLPVPQLTNCHFWASNVTNILFNCFQYYSNWFWFSLIAILTLHFAFLINHAASVWAWIASTRTRTAESTLFHTCFPILKIITWSAWCLQLTVVVRKFSTKFNKNEADWFMGNNNGLQLKPLNNDTLHRFVEKWNVDFSRL